MPGGMGCRSRDSRDLRGHSRGCCRGRRNGAGHIRCLYAGIYTRYQGPYFQVVPFFGNIYELAGRFGRKLQGRFIGFELADRFVEFYDCPFLF